MTRSRSSVVAERLASQMLVRPSGRDPIPVVERLLAVQAQDLRGARLALRARTDGLSIVDIDRALSEDRSLLITWLNRGTLHLVGSGDYWWLQALTTPTLFTTSSRRLAQEGVTPAAADRGVRAITRALAREGPLPRSQLRERLRAAKVRADGQALVHLLMLASLQGITVRGPMVGTEQAYVLVRDWLGEPPPVDRAVALAELGRRYLAGHGPAEDRDLARWAGVPLREARAGLRSIGSELSERPDGLVDLARKRPVDELPPPRLLGPWEPTLVGWTSRRWVLGSNERLVVVGGLFRPFALVRGRAVATWSLKGPEPIIVPFERLSRADRATLEADASDVRRFLGGH